MVLQRSIWPAFIIGLISSSAPLLAVRSVGGMSATQSPYLSSFCSSVIYQSLARVGRDQVLFLECCSGSVHPRQGSNEKLPRNHTCLGCALLAAQCHVSWKVFRKSWPTFCIGFHLCLINSQSKEQAGFYWNLYQTVANQQILIFKHTVVSVTVQMEKQVFLSCMKVLPLQPIFHSAANMIF